MHPSGARVMHLTLALRIILILQSLARRLGGGSDGVRVLFFSMTNLAAGEAEFVDSLVYHLLLSTYNNDGGD